MMLSKKLVVAVLLLALILSACTKSAQPTATQPLPANETASNTTGPTTPVEQPTVTLQPSPAPSATPSQPLLPAIGTPLAGGRLPITVQNAGSLALLANWGRGFIDPHNPAVLQYSPDGRWLAVQSGVGIDLYDAKTGNLAYTLPLAAPRSASFSADGSLLAVSAPANPLVIYRLGGQSPELIDQAPLDNTAACLAFVPGGQNLAYSSPAGLQVYDPATKQATPLKVAASPDQPGCVRLQYSQDGTKLLFQDAAAASVFALPSGEVIARLPLGDPTQVSELSPDGKYLAVGGKDNLVVMDLATQQAAYTLPITSGQVHFTPSSQRLLASGGYYGAASYLVLDLVTGDTTVYPLPLHAFAVAPNGQAVSAVLQNGDLVELPVPQPVKSQIIDLGQGAQNDLFFPSQDGKLVAIAKQGGLVEVRSLADGQLVTSLQNQDTFFGGALPVRSLVFSADNTKLAWAGTQSAQVADLDTGKITVTYCGIRSNVFLVSLSPDGLVIACPQFLPPPNESVVKLYRVGEKEPYLTLTVQVDQGLGFTRDGKQLWVVGNEQLSLWEVATGQQVSATQLANCSDPKGSVAPDNTQLSLTCHSQLLTFELPTLKQLGVTAYPNNGTIFPFYSAAGRLNALAIQPEQSSYTLDGNQYTYAQVKIKPILAEDQQSIYPNILVDQPDQEINGAWSALYTGEQLILLVASDAQNLEIVTPLQPLTGRVLMTDYQAENRILLNADPADGALALCSPASGACTARSAATGQKLADLPGAIYSAGKFYLPGDTLLPLSPPDFKPAELTGDAADAARLPCKLSGVSADLQYGVCADSDNLSLVSLAERKISWSVPGCSAAPEWLQFSSNSAYLGARCGNGIQIFKTADGAVVFDKLAGAGAAGDMNLVNYNLAGERTLVALQSAGQPTPPGTMNLWVVDLDSAQTTEIAVNAWSAMTVTPDASLLAAGRLEKDPTQPYWLILYDPSQGQEIARLPVASPVTSLAFSADGLRLFSLHLDGVLRVWGVGD